jgi:hypothetical protein
MSVEVVGKVIGKRYGVGKVGYVPSAVRPVSNNDANMNAYNSNLFSVRIALIAKNKKKHT